MAKPQCQSATGATTHAEHGQRVAAMFGRIAGWYDFLNHALSGCQDIYWRYRLAKAARPAPGETVLDLAAGTMDVSVELMRQYPDCRVAALDFALPMLETGKARKLKDGREDVIFPVQADGRNLPLPDASMGAATIAFGIRNILPREDAYREFLRVLKPGARLCILEFGTGSGGSGRGCTTSIWTSSCRSSATASRATPARTATWPRPSRISRTNAPWPKSCSTPVSSASTACP